MNGSPKFQPSVVCSFEITALASKKSKTIDLYSDYKACSRDVTNAAFI